MSKRGLTVGRELQSSRKVRSSYGSGNRLCWHRSEGSHSPIRPNDERFGEFRPPRCSDRLCDDPDSTNGGHLSSCQRFQSVIREGGGGQARGCNGEVWRHFGARDHRCRWVVDDSWDVERLFSSMLDKPVGWNMTYRSSIKEFLISRQLSTENSEIEESSVERWSWWCYCSIVQRIDEEVDELLSLRSMDSTFSTMVNGLRICFICNSLRNFFVFFF